jgi:hypothetical protein
LGRLRAQRGSRTRESRLRLAALRRGAARDARARRPVSGREALADEEQR